MNDWMPIMGTRLSIKFSLLSEEWAMRNHGQTLGRLAQRGGICPREAMAIIEGRPFKTVLSITKDAGLDALLGFLEKYRWNGQGLIKLD